MMINDNLFKLQCLIKTAEIQHSVQCTHGKQLYFALATSNSDIILYLKKQFSSPPVIKRIPWFQGSHKQIATFCFDPYGIWLLCITLDSSLYIVPALALINEENYIIDKKWKTDDVTYIRCTNLQPSHFRPTAITWWKDVKTSVDIGIIGTQCGTIILINLSNGQQIGIAHISESIHSLHICQNINNESAFLLITSKDQHQWRLLLEQYTYNLLHNSGNEESHNDSSLSNTTYDNVRSSTPSKSRLQEFKQLSVGKLAIFKQKFIETKNQTLGENLHCHGVASNKKNNVSIIDSEISSEYKLSYINPEPISKDIFLISQYDREDKQLYTCYHSATNHITVHGPNLMVVPLSVHKLFESCKTVLLAHRFFFVTDTSQHVVYIISDQLSESHINGDCEFNSESIVGAFSFKSNKEVIRAVYKITNFNSVTSDKLSQETDTKYTLPKNVKDINIELPNLDTCIIVTNRCIYEVVLRKSLLLIFMELALKKNELEKAGKLAMIFGLNGQHLLEYAGDMFLSNKEFSRAVTSYKLSKCKLLKSVLKFASVGHTSELLSCLTHCLLTPIIIEMPIATRIHLSNLCVLAFIEMTLRAWSEQSKTIYKEFLCFLSTNIFYDELLAINIAGQTYLWEVLHHLATQRSMYSQMLDILMKAIQTFGINVFRPRSYGLLICISEPGLMQAMLISHDLARSHMSFVHSNLRDSQVFVLQRLVRLYDPTNPILRPKLIQCKMRRKSVPCNSQSSQCDSIDNMDNINQSDVLMEEIVETFILILLTLICKKRILNPNPIKSTFFYKTRLLEINKEHSEMTSQIAFKRRPLNTGFSHVALVRNADIYTWGSSVQGCLGTGSYVLRYGTPHAVCFFRSIKIEVFSVSCGHCHTLAVTNNGIYAWGGSQFGQLGLGKVLQCSNPELITSLAQEIIVDAVAGQYHSVALTTDGRIFTWGWGVYGQLGHGNTDERTTPTLVKSLLGIVVCHISAGYAHTLVLSIDGIVYAFGCNVFGQLGTGNNIKSSIPVKVLLPDNITLINTGYFHNLAVSNTNKLYIWGASPQVLRLQAQAQKKIRILEQQDANEKKNKSVEELERRTNNASSLDQGVKESFEDNVQTKCAQTEKLDLDIDKPKKSSESVDFRKLNNDEGQTHLVPSIVDTSLVKGQITQVSAGCHHNALITKDGSLYTWGRNLDGQIGNGTKREVLIPTPLYYNPACMFAQIPPRHNDFKRIQDQEDLNDNINLNNAITNNKNTLEDNEYVANIPRSTHTETHKEQISPIIIKAIGIACGYDYTIAIQPGGVILAWGNNNRAQLGRIPAKDIRDADDKLVLLKSSKRVVRLPHASHIALDIPSQVPGIPTPIISYRSDDVSSLAEYIRPLSIIEKSPGELTLHYVLEHFYGLYNSSRIMTKCIELENYQACSKIAALENDILAAFNYQLKVLDILSIQSSSNYIVAEMSHEATDIDAKTSMIASENTNLLKTSPKLRRNIKRNTELFNKQAKKNLMESLEDSVAKISMKVPTSRSLNNLQVLTQELYSFDCEGGSEELCRNKKSDAPAEHSNSEFNIIEDEQQERGENLISNKNDSSLQHENIVDSSTQDVVRSSDSMKILLNIKDSHKNLYDTYEEKTVFSDKASSCFQNNYIINETIKALKYYLNNINNETNILKCEILQNAIDFWIEHNFPMQSLENVFLEHLNTMYYPLGLLLFCQNMMGRYIDANKFDIGTSNSNTIDLFSNKFCFQVLSRLLQHIDEDTPMPEHIKILSSLIADHYGASLHKYSNSGRDETPGQIMEEIINTMYSQIEDSKLFAHIKDPNAVHHFLATEEDKMVFTCGHHFPLSAYKTNVISTMETKLVRSPSLVLPCTSHYLENILSQTFEPEILCPLCIVNALKEIVEKLYV